MIMVVPIMVVATTHRQPVLYSLVSLVRNPTLASVTVYMSIHISPANHQVLTYLLQGGSLDRPRS